MSEDRKSSSVKIFGLRGYIPLLIVNKSPNAGFTNSATSYVVTVVPGLCIVNNLTITTLIMMYYL